MDRNMLQNFNSIGGRQCCSTKNLLIYYKSFKMRLFDIKENWVLVTWENIPLICRELFPVG
jgi:hypothetical protein